MKHLLTIFFVTIFSVAGAQTLLTLDDAVKIALKNNYDILVSANNAAISKTNNTAGNAGMLPNVALTGSGSYEINDVSQTSSAGVETNYPSLSTKYVSAGAELSWTLFDGGRMFVTKNKLNEIEALGEIQFKDQVLQTQFDVIAAYYDVVRQKQQLNSLNEIINYNTELVKILQVSFNGGSILKNDLLQAKIDLNVYTENAIVQELTISIAKKNLNQLLGLSADSLFEVVDSIPLNFSVDKNELLQKLNASNTSILSFQKQFEIAKLNLKEYSSYRLPVLNLNAGYYLSATNNSAGAMQKNSSFGPQIGGNLTIPLFQSGQVNRQISTAKIEVESAQFNLENVKLQVNTQLLNAIEAFEYQERLLEIEKENNQYATEYLQISFNRMKFGQTNSLEVHQAQENYVQSCTRLINFRYNLKIAETKLKQLISKM